MVLPAPFGPMSPTASPGSTSSVTSSSAVMPAKRFVIRARVEQRHGVARFVVARGLGRSQVDAGRRRGLSAADVRPAAPVERRWIARETWRFWASRMPSGCRA